MPDVKAAVVAGDVSTLKQHKLVVDPFEWPNNVQVVPEDVFNDGSRNIIVPDGFLVPGKSNGGVYIITVDANDITKVTGDRITLTHNKDGYFYHMGYWVDMNNDGRKDFLTAKSNAAAGEGQLVWLEHPEEGISGTWTEHLITNGPDVGIWIDETESKNSIVVYATQFFDRKLAMYQVSTKDGTL